MTAMSIEIRIPELGESVQEVEIVEWRKRKGDAVRRDEDLVQIDSAKSALDIPAPATGTLQEILKRDGEICNVGDVIGIIEESDEAAEKETAPEPQRAEDEEAPGRKAEPGETEKAPGKKAEPGEVEEASGREPARGQAKKVFWRKREPGEAEEAPRPEPEPAASPATPQVEEAASADRGREEESAEAIHARGREREEEIVPMSMIRRHIARRLVRAQHEAALLTTFNEVDMSAVNDLRQKYREPFQEKYGVKLGLMSFFAKSTVECLKSCPALNAEIRDRHIVYRNYYDLGIAIGTSKGLVVPVLPHVERMSFAEIERAIGDLAERAEQGKLHPEELEGGTFTISNGGIYGSLLSTPIVNPPQSGILGMHAIQERPVARSGEVVIRPMMYVALTYDHRIVDGREAVSFLASVKARIEDPASILLEL
jgi:2-oxoglutarate dehydrogenase E2 component (dihydrolipoamide succinyltransferase)